MLICALDVINNNTAANSVNTIGIIDILSLNSSCSVCDSLKYKYNVITGIKYAWEYVPSSKLYSHSVFKTGMFKTEMNVNNKSIAKKGVKLRGIFMLIDTTWLKGEKIHEYF